MRSGGIPKRRVVLQAADERLEGLRNDHYLIIPFLVDVNDLRFPNWPAGPVVQTQHVMTSGWAVCKVNADVWVAPLLDPELTPNLAAQ